MNGSVKIKKERADSYGNKISKGGRKHKINFKETINEVHEVENWKKYNMIDEEGTNKCKNCTLY